MDLFPSLIKKTNNWFELNRFSDLQAIYRVNCPENSNLNGQISKIEAYIIDDMHYISAEILNGYKTIGCEKDSIVNIHFHLVNGRHISFLASIQGTKTGLEVKRYNNENATCTIIKCNYL